jgi:Spy/CpxP family protein refolding chaperone
MSLKRKIIAALISMFAVVAFTTFVSAQDANKDDQNSTQKQERRERRGFGDKRGFRRGMRDGRGGGLMRGFEQLNLTDAQKEKIHSILEANKPDPKTFETLRPLVEAKRNGTITAEQEAQLKAHREEMKQKHEEVRAQLLAVLTAEQKAQLDKLKEEWKQKREERRQMRQERMKQQQVPPTEKKDN